MSPSGQESGPEGFQDVAITACQAKVQLGPRDPSKPSRLRDGADRWDAIGQRPSHAQGILAWTDVCLYVTMCAVKRTALFLKEEQLSKLQVLSEKTGAPVAELVRRAIDKYLQERAKELK